MVVLAPLCARDIGAIGVFTAERERILGKSEKIVPKIPRLSDGPALGSGDGPYA
jgi:hypothetical protein